MPLNNTDKTQTLCQNKFGYLVHTIQKKLSKLHSLVTPNVMKISTSYADIENFSQLMN